MLESGSAIWLVFEARAPNSQSQLNLPAALKAAAAHLFCVVFISITFACVISTSSATTRQTNDDELTKQLNCIDQLRYRGKATITSGLFV